MGLQKLIGDYVIQYEGGDSAFNPGNPVDFMIGYVGDIELYAETPADPENEIGTYEELKEAIVEQAKEAGIDTKCLRFWFDSEDDRTRLVEVGISLCHSDFGEWQVSEIQLSPYNIYDDLKGFLAEMSSDLDVYVLGIDQLPEHIEDIRGRIHNQPLHVIATHSVTDGLAYVGLESMVLTAEQLKELEG